MTLGTTYRVTFEDCCVQGQFTSMLVKDDEEGNDDLLIYSHAYTFENGVIIGGHGVDYKEIP